MTVSAGGFTRAALLLGLLLSSLPLQPRPAHAVENALARTTVSEVAQHRFSDGDPADLGYEIKHEVLQTMGPEDSFPTARIDPAAHPGAFEGQWADNGFHAAWVAPKGEFQYFPNAYTVEGGYFSNYIQPDGAPLAPGDEVDIAVKQLALDAPLTWDRQRGEADGELEWDVATRLHTISGSYGSAGKTMDIVFIRADLIARGGDVDARDTSMDLPVLEVDLPKTWGPDVTAGGAITQFAPYLHYMRNVEGQILPQAGKAIFTGDARGYIPEGREVTVGGTRIREWHIPLDITLTFVENTGLLGGQTMSQLPSGGAVWSIDATGARRTIVPPGASVLTTPGQAPLVLGGNPRSGGEGEATPAAIESQQPAAAVGSSGTLMDDIASTASIDRTLDSPVHLRIAKRSYDFTVDPDLNGEGILALTSASDMRTGRPFFESAAVPYVTIDGTTIKLDRSRLVDLRVVPLFDYLAIGFTSLNNGNALTTASHATTRWGRINRPAVRLEAVYDLGEDRYGIFTGFAMVDAENTGVSLETYFEVQSFSGAPAHMRAVHYMQLSEPGPITYDGQAMTTEFSGPAKGLRTPTGQVFGGMTGGSQMTVVRAGGPLMSTPTVTPEASIVDRDIAVYITSRDGTTNGAIGSALLSWLDETGPPATVDPGPIDQPCTQAQVSDTSAAPPGIPANVDVQSAWFDFDGHHLLSTIQVADLDPGVVGSPVTFRSSWRFEHIGYGLQATRDVTGAWAFNIGIHSSSGAPWGPINSVPVAGEIQYGSPGFIRMSTPIDVGLSGTGFLDGELLRDTGAMSRDANGVRDRAPDGAADEAFGRGADFLIKTCEPIPADTVLEIVPVLGQYTDDVTLTARLRDAAGEPVAGVPLDLELHGTTRTATTDSTGTAQVPVNLTMKPGKYPVTASFVGSEGYEPSSATSDVTVEREDSKLALSVKRKRAFRILKARMVDQDSGAPVAGMRVKFYRGGKLLRTVKTGERGWATLWHRPPGRAPRRYRASFGGTALWIASGAKTSG